MTERTGNCFENCARFLIDAVDSDIILVHAQCTGRGEIAGVEYGHAFLLLGDGAVVLDLTTDQPVACDAGTYYDIGNVREVARYTRDEMMTELRAWEHFGPWADALMELAN